VTAPLYLIQDDLFFAERVRGAARRLGLDLVARAPAEAGGRTWDTDSVVVVQVTLNPDRQLALVERLLQSKPAPRVIAVARATGSALACATMKSFPPVSPTRRGYAL